MGCWGCCRKDFLLSLLLSSQPPQTPQGTKRLSLAGTQAAGQTVLTSYLLLGNQGPQRKVTRPAGGLTRAGGGGPLFKQRDATEREGGSLECPWTPPQTRLSCWPWSKEPRVHTANSSKEEGFLIPASTPSIREGHRTQYPGQQSRGN